MGDFEWYQSNQKTAYPFTSRQVDNIHELFVDAAVYHNLERIRESDLRLHYYKLGTPATVELRFADGTVLAVLADGGSGVTFQQINFGSYTIYEWRRSTVTGEGFTNEDIVVRLVILTAKLTSLPATLSPADGTLIASLVNPRIKRVRRLFVKRALTGEIDLVTHDKVRFEAGNNLEFVLDEGVAGIDPTTRQPTTVVINAAPELGAGPVYRCSGTEGIKRINGIEPDDRGDLKLEGSLCSWFERPMQNPGPPIHPHTDGTLEPANAQWPYDAPTVSGPGLILHQDCEACCACEDYINAYRAMQTWWERAQAVATRIAQIQETYNQLCALINAGSGKIPRGVSTNLLVMPRPDFNFASGMLLYNNSDVAIGTTEMTIEVDQDQSVVEYITRSGYLDFGASNNVQIDPVITAGGSGTQFKVVIPSLEVGAFVRFSINIRFNSLLANRANAVITGKAIASWSGGTTEDVQRMQLTPPTQKS